MSFDDVARRMGDRHRQNMIPGAFENMPTDDDARAARSTTRMVIGSTLLLVGLMLGVIGGAAGHPVWLGGLPLAGLGVRFIRRAIVG